MLARLPAARRLIRLAGPFAVVAVLLTATGCSQADSVLTRQTGTVVFRPQTSRLDKQQVTKGCSKAPLKLRTHISRDGKAVTVTFVYQDSQVSAHDLATFYSCLRRFPAVTGVAVKDRLRLPPSE
ncbi:MAG TPA: hypothetical protein VK823_05125 [Streptosporangiaceae bacterium]|nr:hypothetical protein [Streptosporangiaceae bacterium]